MKVNRIIAGIMAVCVMGFGVPYVNTISENNSTIMASAADYTEGTYEQLSYKNYGDYIEISDCDESATEIVIPSKIDGVPVTSIGGIAFYGCSNLTSVNIPDSVTYIGNNAFVNCSNLKSIEIPDSVVSLGVTPFKKTLWLEEKRKENPFVIVNGILIDGNTCSGDVVIPDNVTDIASYAFDECSDLTSVTFSDKVKSIGEFAFFRCSGLKTVEIPDGVTSIGGWAFGKCTSLTSIIIPNSVTYIGRSPFNETLWLEEKRKENPLVIVNNILIDGETCSGDVIIPDNVTSIADWAFASCESLTSVIIPDNVRSTGDYSFHVCADLQSVTILNPYCEIHDNNGAFCNDIINNFSGTIYGYENSTAQAYAEKYRRSFVSLGTAPEKETATGDMNGDNSVNIADAVLLQQYILGSETLTEEQLKSADMNSDGFVDSFDLVLLRRKVIENK